MSIRDQAWVAKRLDLIKVLNANVQRLDAGRLEEYKKTIRHSYDTASIIKHVAIGKSEEHVKRPGLRSIGIRRRIELRKFNDPSYYWGPYFSDIGRAIAAGERRYLQERIRNSIKPDIETISPTVPNFDVLTERISFLRQQNLEPDTILVPIQLYVDFAKFYEHSMDWRTGQPELLDIDGASLKVFWSHGNARLYSFVIFSSKAGVWHLIPDKDTGHAVTVAIGEREESGNYVEYWVETLVYYEVINQRAFARINLSHRKTIASLK